MLRNKLSKDKPKSAQILEEKINAAENAIETTINAIAQVTGITDRALLMVDPSKLLEQNQKRWIEEDWAAMAELFPAEECQRLKLGIDRNARTVTPGARFQALFMENNASFYRGMLAPIAWSDERIERRHVTDDVYRRASALRDGDISPRQTRVMNTLGWEVREWGDNFQFVPNPIDLEFLFSYLKTSDSEGNRYTDTQSRATLSENILRFGAPEHMPEYIGIIAKSGTLDLYIDYMPPLLYVMSPGVDTDTLRALQALVEAGCNVGKSKDAPAFYESIIEDYIIKHLEEISFQMQRTCKKNKPISN